MILGIDTSCYTTSVALAENGKIIDEKRSPLKVEKGSRGLRQSDGVFMHIKALPSLVEAIAKNYDLKKVEGVIASTRPRPEEGSYMPVFVAGTSFARALASALGVPFYETSHQEGHIMAAIASLREPFTKDDFMSVHISGGTSEILRTKRVGAGFEFKLCAATLDLHAGQLIDRIGVAMGYDFPCGPALDRLALCTNEGVKLPVTLKGADFHLSGAESKAEFYLKNGEKNEKIARGVINAIAKSIKKSLEVLYNEEIFTDVIIGGGVSASRVLREELKSDKFNIYFSEPLYSTDNACGVALIGDMLKNNE